MSGNSILRIFCVVAVTVVFLTATIGSASFLSDKQTLAEIQPELDFAVNNCFQEIRKTIDNEVVYLERINPDTNLLVNKYDGYKMIVPYDWKLDNVNYQFVTNLHGDDFKFSIFREEIDLSYDSTEKYINYSNYQIRQNYGKMTLLTDEMIPMGAYTAQTISWKRDRIPTVSNDLNYYWEYNIVLDNKTVLTFLLKSNEKNIEYYRQKIDKTTLSLVLINQTRDQTYPQIFKDISIIGYNGKSMSLAIPGDKCLFGIYHAPHSYYTNELADLEKRLDFKFELIMEYYSFKVPYKEAEEGIVSLYGDGRTMMITLQPFTTRTAADHNGSCLIPRIVNGEYDKFLFEWASGLKAMGEPVFLRFANEMNGDWTEWCSWFYDLDPDLYIMAWNRVYTLFEQVGADNVYFVWNPHDRTYPDYNWNKEYLYYPGNSKVDWIGLTAYNNGKTRSNEEWRDFEECYSELYHEYMLRYYTKPFMIAEFACNEIGGDKAEWINQGFGLLKEEYPNIRIAVWWNGVDKSWIYDIDSTLQSTEAFKKAVESPYFQVKAVQLT